MKKLLAATVAVLTLACTPAQEENEQEGITLEEMRRKAQQKLVCVNNRSGFDLRVELYTRRSAEIGEVHVQPRGEAQKWINRSKFTTPMQAIIKPVGAPDAVPPQFADMTVNNTGTPIGLTVSSRKGGMTAFAHSSRVSWCVPREQDGGE